MFTSLLWTEAMMSASTRNLILIILMENAMNNLITLEHRVHYIISYWNDTILFCKHNELLNIFLIKLNAL